MRLASSGAPCRSTPRLLRNLLLPQRDGLLERVYRVLAAGERVLTVRRETAMITLVSPIPTRPTRWAIATLQSSYTALQIGREIGHDLLPCPHRPRTRDVARCGPVTVCGRYRRTSRCRPRARRDHPQPRPEVEGSLAQGEGAARTVVSERPRRRPRAPLTGCVFAVHRVEQPGGSSPRSSADQTSATRAPAGRSRARWPSPARSRRPAKSRTITCMHQAYDAGHGDHRHATRLAWPTRHFPLPA